MISAAIFTLNEEVNLPACLASLKACDDVVVVDSGSTDRTEAIAREAGARFCQHDFTGFGDQRTWALQHVPFRHPWVLILDADERMTEALWNEMKAGVDRQDARVSAFRLKRRFCWEGKWLRHANLYPSWVVRLVRVGKVRYVNRGHAETQEVDGEIGAFQEDLLDENRKGLEAWRERQRHYAEEEARFEAAEAGRLHFADCFSLDPLRRRAAWKVVARHLPARGLGYFVYAALLRGGWMDGWTGIRFCLEKARFQSLIARVKRKRTGPSRAAAGLGKGMLFVLAAWLAATVLVALIGEVGIRSFFKEPGMRKTAGHEVVQAAARDSGP